MMNVKIATLNLCLGLKNKRLEVERLMINNNVDVMCLQEVEIEKDYNFNTLDTVWRLKITPLKQEWACS